MIIYCILNLINGKMYIGKSKHDDIKSFRSRPIQHLVGRGSKLVVKAVKKYGIENFIVLILHKENCTKEKLNELEIYYISHFKTLGRGGYNQTKGGEGVFSTAEIRKKKSESAIKAHKRPEVKKRHKEALKISQNRPETKIKIGKAHLGSIRSAESKKKSSESAKISMNTPETKKKVCEAQKIAQNNPYTKKKKSDSQRYAMHTHYHWNCGIINVDCRHCIDQIMKEHS